MGGGCGCGWHGDGEGGEFLSLDEGGEEGSSWVAFLGGLSDGGGILRCGFLSLRSISHSQYFSLIASSYHLFSAPFVMERGFLSMFFGV